MSVVNLKVLIYINMFCILTDDQGGYLLQYLKTKDMLSFDCLKRL